jgi:hypothetical protein
MSPAVLHAVLPLLALLACGGEAPAPAVPAPPTATPPAAGPLAAEPAPHTLLVNGLLNSGFELLADSTTDPPKYGAYWLGAFARTEGDPTSWVVESDAFRGQRFLRLSAVTSEVLQKIVADPRHTASLRVSCALRCRREGELLLALEDGPGRRAALRVSTAGGALRLRAEDGGELPEVERRALDLREASGSAAHAENEAEDWRRLSLDLGALFALRHGAPAVPRLNLRLRAVSPAPGLVDLDEVLAEVRWPLPSEAELADYVQGLVREALAAWFEPRASGGLGLVDPATGYVRHGNYDVVSGAPGPAERAAGFHTIHTLLIEWLREARRRGLDGEVARWTPHLQRSVSSVLEHNFDPQTGLPRMVSLPALQPQDELAVALGPWVEFLLDAREQVGDEALAARCLAQARRIADTLVALQQRHDLPREQAPPGAWNEANGRIEGNTRNWFGHIPDRLTPRGEIEYDRRFYTSWAILTGRSFWYELLRAPRAVARVHAQEPRPHDVPAIRRAVLAYERPWDATRYDLENDTDDHYGYHAEDGLEIVRDFRHELPEALELVLAATDHRLPRDAAHAGDTLWIQAVRLGSACAGDSPRAFFGPLELYELPDDVSPSTHGLPLYRDALLELARNDLQGRQLTNSQFTESFFQDWEMVCICFRGTFQGDCRHPPPEGWHGDVGDTFGGPPTTAIDAQQAAWRVAGPGERLSILAALGLIRDVTDAALRRPYGWLFGLDEAIARQYELPDNYVLGLSGESAAGLGYVMAWMRLLPFLSDAELPAPPRVEVVEAPGGRVARVTGPPGALGLLVAADSDWPATVPIGADARVVALELPRPGRAPPPHADLVFDEAGVAEVPLPLPGGPAAGVLQAGVLRVRDLGVARLPGFESFSEPVPF